MYTLGLPASPVLLPLPRLRPRPPHRCPACTAGWASSGRFPSECSSPPDSPRRHAPAPPLAPAPVSDQPSLPASSPRALQTHAHEPLSCLPPAIKPLIPIHHTKPVRGGQSTAGLKPRIFAEHTNVRDVPINLSLVPSPGTWPSPRGSARMFPEPLRLTAGTALRADRDDEFRDAATPTTECLGSSFDRP